MVSIKDISDQMIDKFHIVDAFLMGRGIEARIPASVDPVRANDDEFFSVGNLPEIGEAQHLFTRAKPSVQGNQCRQSFKKCYQLPERINHKASAVQAIYNDFATCSSLPCCPAATDARNSNTISEKYFIFTTSDEPAGLQ